MLNIIGIIALIISGFCFITVFSILVVMLKTIKKMDKDEKVAALESIITKPINNCITLIIVGVVSLYCWQIANNIDDNHILR